MSQMPTLFDDEEYFIPQPQKEVKKNTPKKGKKATEPEATADPEQEAIAEPQPEETPDAELIKEQAATGVDTQPAPTEENLAAAPETEAESLDEAAAAEPVMAIPEGEAPGRGETIAISGEGPEETEVIETIEEEITDTKVVEEEIIIAIAAEDQAPGAEAETTPEAEIEEALIAAQAEPETEEPEEEILAEEPIPEAEILVTESEMLEPEEESTAPATEITDEAADTFELAEAVAEQITFEIPEVEEEVTEQEISIAPIKEDPVDNLDKLMFTEMVALDYTAYAGLSFEPEPAIEQQSLEEQDSIEPEHVAEPVITDEEQSWEENLDTETAEKTTALPEFNLENKYYTIGEVAQMFGVNVSHIRFWTTEFSLKVRTTRKGDRLYNPENIGKLRLIHHLVKENKHTIKGAKEQLKARKQAINAQVDLKDKLSSLKAQLERIKRNL